MFPSRGKLRTRSRLKSPFEVPLFSRPHPSPPMDTPKRGTGRTVSLQRGGDSGTDGRAYSLVDGTEPKVPGSGHKIDPTRGESYGLGSSYSGISSPETSVPPSRPGPVRTRSFPTPPWPVDVHGCPAMSPSTSTSGDVLLDLRSRGRTNPKLGSRPTFRPRGRILVPIVPDSSCYSLTDGPPPREST